MIDKRLLIDTVAVSLAGAKDKWGKFTYQEPFEVKYVRFDRSSIDKSSTTQGLTNITRNKSGTIFIYPKFNNVVVDDSWLQANIKDKHGDYKVISFETNYLGNKVFSYEVTVI
nr:MAG TPA: Minor capsid protein [Caudoviricetes sp.]DAK02090.1 MAG TPA: Minor capsid protein [Caudoviricetes sp.]